MSAPLQRTRHLALVAAVLAGCQAGGGSATVDRVPMATSPNAVTVVVESIETGGDRTTATVTVINGNDDAQRLAQRSDPALLIDSEGNAISAAEEEIRVPEYAVDRLTLTFAGVPSGATATLRFNAEHSNASLAPALTVSDIPLQGRRTTFEAPLPAGGPLQGLQANHANGSTLRLTEVAFGETDIAVGFEAVNGLDAPIKLTRRSDPLLLQDDVGNRYPVVPALTNPDLQIPEGQTLRGTLRFAGRVAPDASALTLVSHSKFGGVEDYARSPRFVIEFPPIAR